MFIFAERWWGVTPQYAAAADQADVLAAADRIKLVLQNITISVLSLRDASQAMNMEATNCHVNALEQRVDDALASASIADLPLAALRACVEAVSPDTPIGRTDERFQSQVLGCTLDDQKALRLRLASLLRKAEDAERTIVRLPLAEKERRRYAFTLLRAQRTAAVAGPDTGSSTTAAAHTACAQGSGRRPSQRSVSEQDESIGDRTPTRSRPATPPLEGFISVPAARAPAPPTTQHEQDAASRARPVARGTSQASVLQQGSEPRGDPPDASAPASASSLRSPAVFARPVSQSTAPTPISSGRAPATVALTDVKNATTQGSNAGLLQRRRGEEEVPTASFVGSGSHSSSSWRVGGRTSADANRAEGSTPLASGRPFERPAVGTPSGAGVPARAWGSSSEDGVDRRLPSAAPPPPRVPSRYPDAFSGAAFTPSGPSAAGASYRSPALVAAQRSAAEDALLSDAARDVSSHASSYSAGRGGAVSASSGDPRDPGRAAALRPAHRASESMHGALSPPEATFASVAPLPRQQAEEPAWRGPDVARRPAAAATGPGYYPNSGSGQSRPVTGRSNPGGDPTGGMPGVSPYGSMRR